VVINKIDRGDARIGEVVNEVYDLFIDLDASEAQIEFPILYTNAKTGVAHEKPGDGSTNLKPLFDALFRAIPGPEAHDGGIPQFLVTNLDYDPYVGQLAIGRLANGTLEMKSVYALCGTEDIRTGIQFSTLYTFVGLNRVPVDRVEAGDIIAVAGLKGWPSATPSPPRKSPVPCPGYT